MQRMLIALFISGVCASTNAQLQTLDEQQMAKYDGQSGIVIDLDMSINRVLQDDNTVASAIDCNDATDCDFGLALDGMVANSILHPDMNANQYGKQQWLVIHNLSGGLSVKNLAVKADKTPSGRPAISIGQGAKDASGSIVPVLLDFDYFGFDSMRFDTDAVDDTPGYRVQPDSQSGNTLSLDQNIGRPPGLIGMRLHGSAEMKGSIKIFNCKGISGC